ncbi:MAG: oleate hydratase [Pseudomonadota bacterium]
MKIAVIGSGIAGMAAAYYLHHARTRVPHEVHLFEAGDRLGGHTATKQVRDGEQMLAIDTGFIVYNDWTYPNFIELLTNLDIRSQPTEMSFSVSDAVSGLEYKGSSINTLFAQRANVVSPRFWRLLADIARFNRQVERHLAADPALGNATLGDYLREQRYSSAFAELYLIPMGAAIWSSDHGTMLNFPLQFFVRFFRNHGLLNVVNRPQWRVLEGGSSSYIVPLTTGYSYNIHLRTPVQRIERGCQVDGKIKVAVHSKRGCEYFDQVVLACHSDQALRLLGDPTAAEKSILGAIPYCRNEVVLHRDERLLPRNRRAWSSWNVKIDEDKTRPATLTYNMNILQDLHSKNTWCVTLNQTNAIREELIEGIYHYEHPVFTQAGIAAQQRWEEINGVNGTWYCGAWWRNGFHEDGVWSALRVANELGQLSPTVTPVRVADYA